MPTETPATPDTKLVAVPATDPALSGAIRSLGRAGLIGLLVLCLTIAVTGYFIYNRPVIAQIKPPLLSDGTAPTDVVKTEPVEEEKDPTWMTCGAKKPIFEDEHGRYRYFDIPNEKSKLGLERMKVYGLGRERECVRYEFVDGKKTENYVVVKDAVLTSDDRCLVNDKIDPDLVVKQMCIDDDGKISTAKKYENNLSTEPTPVPGLSGIRASCCVEEGGPINACQSEDDSKIARR